MKVRTKLIIGFSLIVVLIWAIVVHAGGNLSSLNEQFSAVEEEILPDNIAMTELETLSNHIYREVSAYLYHGTDESRNTALSHLDRLKAIGLDYLPDVAMPGMTEHGKDSDLAGKIFDFYFSSLWIIELKERGADYDTIHSRDHNMTLPALLAMQESASNIKAVGVTELTAVKEAVNQSYADGMSSIYISAAFISLLAIAASILVTRSIARPLIALRKGTEMVARGDLNYKVGTEAKDEIGELSRDFDKMTESLSTSMTSIDNLNQEITERKRAEEKQKAILETALEGFWICDTAGNILEVNDSYCKITGYTREELLKMSIKDVEASEKSTDIAHRIQKITKSGADRFETRHRRKDGKIIDIEISVNYLNIDDGLMVVFVRDISERKQAEVALRESEEKFSKAFRSSPNAISISTLAEGVFLEVNDSFTRGHGYTRKETLGRSSKELDIWVFPKEREKIIKHLRNKGRIINEEYHSRLKSGEVHTMLLSAELINMAGVECMLAVTTDITERKQAEEALKHNEERFRLIADNSADLISRIQLTPTIRTDYVSPSCLRITGYKQEEFYNDPNLGLQMIHPEDREFFQKTVNFQEKQSQKPINVRLIRKDGRIRWIEQTHTIISNELGEPIAVHLIAHDITERRQAEQALKESEEKFSKAFHAIPDAISISTLSDGTFLEVNDSYTRILGYSREELMGENATALNIWAVPEQKKIMLEKISKRIRMHNEEYLSRSKSGEIRTMLFSSEYIQIKGEPCMLAVSVDITERKRIEEALKEREKRFSDIVENALEWIWEVNADGKYIYSSPVVEQILGYKQKDILTKYFYDLFVPEEREDLKKAAFEAFAQRQPIKNFINKNVRKDGRTVYLMTSGVPVFDEDNNWTGYRGVDTDITENIQAEQALKESEEKFSKAFFSSPEIMVIINQENRQYIEVNDSFLKTTGYSRDEIKGHKIEELVMLENREDEAKMSRLFEEQGKVTGEEFNFRMKSGEVLTWLCSMELITLGGVPCMLAAATDITRRKRAEQLQKDENHILTLLGQGAELDELLDAIVRMGESHDPLIRGSILLFDSSREMLLQASGPNLPPDYKRMMNNGVPLGPVAGSCGTAAFKKERVIIPDVETSPLFAPFTEVVKQLNKDGLLACWSQPILASNGDLLGTIANYSTKKGEPEPINLIILEWSARTAAIAIERKRAEQALKESEEKFSKAFRSSPQQVIITRLRDGITLDVNDSFIRSTGFTREETVGHSAEVLDIWVNPGDRKRMMRLLNEQGRIVNEEFQFYKKSGEIHTDLLSVEMVNIGGDECMLSLLTDITERKKAEEALRLSDAAFKSIHESVIVTDLDGYITHWNKISEQLFGIKAEDAIGKKFLEVIDVSENYPGESEDRIAKIKKAGHWEDERLYRTPNGDIWVDVHLQDIVGEGKRYGRVMLASDITQRKQAEERLRQALSELEQSSAQLAATNRELEAFSYSVSHDLRSPLRSIDGFSQALLEDYSDKLDETGKDFLQRLRNASQKMGELIDGLLKLSRLTRSEMHRESVDLSALAEDITTRLQETRQGRHARFLIDKGLSVNGDPQLLRVLLENLLSNAWKFTRKKREAKIEFGAVQTNGKKTYFVKDNGAGFDMTYSDKLFGAFQRLHDSTEFPGTGIGLATVQRIINRHGGTIRAEGTPGKGATFYFTLD